MEGLKWGYARVSTKGQNLDRQIIELIEEGIPETRIFVDKATGVHFEREQYQRLKDFVRKGDVIYFSSLDRLGRDYAGIHNEWKDITERIGADIVILDSQGVFDSRRFRQQAEVGKLMQDLFLSIFSYLADTRRKEILRTQAAGIAAARKEGKHLGRPKRELTEDERRIIYLWAERSMTSKAAAKALNCSERTIFNYARSLGVSRKSHS